MSEVINSQTLQIIERKKYKAGEYLFKQGEKGNNLYILQDGEIEVYVDDQLIDIISEQGAIVGEAAPLLKQPRSATLKFSKDSEVIVVPGDYIDKIILSNPEIGFNILKMVIERLNSANKQIVRLTKLVQHYKKEIEKIKGEKEKSQEYRLGELFYQAGIITKAQLEECLKIQKESAEKGIIKPLGRILIEKGYATSFQVIQIMQLQKSLMKEKK
jgi:CRP-like cAMP-binding protein